MKNNKRQNFSSPKIGEITRGRDFYRFLDNQFLQQHLLSKQLVRAPYAGEFPEDRGYQSVVLTRSDRAGRYCITPVQEDVATVQSYIDRGILQTPFTDALIEADKR